MKLLQKFFENKKIVKKFIKENGMEEAVKKYGINKLVNYKLMYQYEGTELYHTDMISVIQRVYNKQGKHLGNITELMSPFCRHLGYYFGPCLNGNIILYKCDKDKSLRSYAVFNKHGNPIVNYGKFVNYCYLPNGVAIMGMDRGNKNNMITIHYDGTIKTQLFTYIERNEEIGGYELCLREDGQIKLYHTDDKVALDMVDSSTELGDEVKGIE